MLKILLIVSLFAITSSFQVRSILSESDVELQISVSF